MNSRQRLKLDRPTLPEPSIIKPRSSRALQTETIQRVKKLKTLILNQRLHLTYEMTRNVTLIQFKEIE